VVHRGDLRALYPVFAGELQHHSSLGDMHGDFFFKDGSMPACQGDVVVEAVEDKWSIWCVWLLPSSAGESYVGCYHQQS